MVMEEIIEDLIPVRDYDGLMKKLKWSERLNVLLFFSILCALFLAFVAIGAHTYQYEKRLDQSLQAFKEDVLALTGDQNLAIRDLNSVVRDRNWINFQRISLEQLQGFCDLREDDPTEIIVINSDEKEGVGGK
jgi:hypothetical protein